MILEVVAPGILRGVSENAGGSVAEGKLRIAPTDPVEVRALYDAWAERYDEDLDAWEYRTPTHVAELLREAQPDAARVLDVGCGTGRTGRALRAAGFTAIIGCDLSPNALARATATGAYERVVEVDLQQLPTPFADDAFDALCCVGVLTYLPNTEATLREFFRLVRPAGAIAFSQREDVWLERDCCAVIGRLVLEGACEAVHISEPRPYLPGSDELGDVGAVLCLLRLP